MDPFLADLQAKGVGLDNSPDDEAPPAWLKKGSKKPAADPFAADLEKKGIDVSAGGGRQYENTGPDVAGQLRAEAADQPGIAEIAKERVAKSFGNLAHTVGGAASAAGDVIAHPSGLVEGLSLDPKDNGRPDRGRKRREFLRGVADTTTAGLANKAAASVDPASFGPENEAKDEAEAGKYRNLGQMTGVALPSPAAALGGKVAETVGGTGVVGAVGRGLAGYEGMAIPSAMIAAPSGSRLQAGLDAATDPASLALAGGLPAASQALSEYSSGPSANARRAEMIKNARARATKDIGNDIVAAEGPRARVTDQKRIAEVNDQLFNLTQENPELRPVWRQSAEKALPKIDSFMRETMEPRAGLYKELDDASLGIHPGSAVPEEILDGPPTAALQDPNFSLHGEAAPYEAPPRDIPDETPRTLRQTQRLEIPNYETEGINGPRNTSRESGFLDETKPEVELGDADVMSSAEAPQGGLPLKDIVEGYRKAARDAIDPAKGGGTFGEADAARLNGRADQMIRVYGKQGEPVFNPDAIVNSDGTTAQQMLDILGRRPNAKGVPEAMEQVRAMATTPAGIDMNARVPALHFRKEVTESAKATEQALGGLEGTARHEALDKLYQVGHGILDKHIDESGMDPARIAQLRKMNNDYFLLQRAKTAIESRGWKESTRPGFHWPHGAMAALRTGSIPTMALAGAMNPHAIPELALGAGAMYAAPAIASRVNWRLANMDPVGPQIPAMNPMLAARAADVDVASNAAAEDDTVNLAKQALADPEATAREKARALQILRGE